MKRQKLRIFLAAGIGGLGAIAPINLSSITIAPIAISQPALADNAPIDHQPQVGSLAPSSLLAQNTELGCRQTNASTGVYVQPNLNSAAQGMLNPAQTVRLESKGEGWARINQPIIGWVESEYLTPAVPCDALNGTATIQTPPQQRITALPPVAPASSPQPDLANTAPVTPPVTPPITPPAKVICEVLPVNGLAVRSEPIVEGQTYLTTLTPGTHEFQFTRDAKVMPSEAGDRRWVYITAPSVGWITLGFVDSPSNLGGQKCESLP